MGQADRRIDLERANGGNMEEVALEMDRPVISRAERLDQLTRVRDVAGLGEPARGIYLERVHVLRGAHVALERLRPEGAVHHLAPLGLRAGDQPLEPVRLRAAVVVREG